MATETLKSKTAKGVFWSSASNLLSQVVNMLFGLVLARILAPEDYGIVGLLTVFTGLATALQECGLSSALINKKDASQKDYDTVFWFTAGSSVVLYVILFFDCRFLSYSGIEAFGSDCFLGICIFFTLHSSYGSLAERAADQETIFIIASCYNYFWYMRSCYGLVWIGLLGLGIAIGRPFLFPDDFCLGCRTLETDFFF